ncbi:hypothetical protein BcDW1_7849 [Botrytis cinerea BcDW1]|uniref:Uncharacterized protein n=1 Tax=Botryotinia fuckeliana (strain BcDW1) TaxID=1290391 RepID=M7UA46_BOTF1|nr:hypothetical protein BcDW1_7849 [Botrytis cinerea BcDW1]
MHGSDDEAWLSSLTPSRSATKGFGKEFRPVKYTGEYADRDMHLWQQAMKELKAQMADRKAAEKEWADKVKEEEVSIAKFL